MTMTRKTTRTQISLWKRLILLSILIVLIATVAFFVFVSPLIQPTSLVLPVSASTTPGITVVPGLMVEQPIKLPNRAVGISSIYISFGTYELSDQPGTINVTVINPTTSEILDTVSFDLSQALDNKAVEIPLNQLIAPDENHELLLRLEAEDDVANSSFLLWETEVDVSNMGQHAIVNGVESQNYLLLRSMVAIEQTSFAKKLYLVISIILLIGIILVYTAYNFRKTRLAFVFAAYMLGLILMIVYPPYGVFDEAIHIPSTFARATAWQHDQWDFDPNEPVLLRYEERMEPYTQYRATIDQYTHLYQDFFSRESGSDPIYIKTRSAGLPYESFPQIIAVIAARHLRLGQTATLYLAGFAALSFYILLAYWALRITPFPGLFTVLSLSPMALRSAGSFSYDCFINAVSLVLLALLLKMIFSREKLKPSQLVACFLLSVILAPCKIIYIVMPMLLFLVPKENWAHGRAGQFGYMATVFVVSGIALFAANSAELLSRITARGTTGGPWNNVSYSTAMLLKEPLQAFRLFITSTFDYQFTLLLDALINIQHAEIPFTTAVCFMLLAILVTDQRKTDITMKHKIVFLLCFMLIEELAFLAAIPWTSVANYHIEGMQGRYLIPVLPLFFLLFANTIKPRISRGIALAASIALNFYAAIYIFASTFAMVV